MENTELAKLLREVRTRLSQFATRIEFGHDDYADILSLSKRIGDACKALGYPVLIKCETRKAPAKYRVQIDGMVSDVSSLLVIRALDAENPNLGIQTARPKSGWNPDGSEVEQSPSRVLELLDRSIRFVEAKAEESRLYTQPIPKSEVRTMYGLSERQFSEWLKLGKIPCIANEKRTLRLLVSEYERIKHEN